MTIHIALLRGINVSGKKLIKMTELKQMFESMGFNRVQTYIQSGNVLFEAGEDVATLRQRIERQIEIAFDFDVPVVVRTAAELNRIIQDCPYDSDALQHGESLYVALLSETPSQEGIDRLLACSSDIDECRIAGREVYILCRQGFGNSMFSNNFLEKKLKVPATTRNWQTINKLAELGNELEL